MAAEEWVQKARGLIAESRYQEARSTLESVASENDGALFVPKSMEARWEDIADAEECMAAICLIEGKTSEAVGHAQQAILRSRRFRAGAHLLAARALGARNEIDLARSKLEMVVERSDDIGIAMVSAAEIAALSSY